MSAPPSITIPKKTEIWAGCPICKQPISTCCCGISVAKQLELVKLRGTKTIEQVFLCNNPIRDSNVSVKKYMKNTVISVKM